MDSIQNMLFDIDFTVCSSIIKFPKIGNVLHMDTELFNGYYWYYENENFLISIHDLYIKKEFTEKDFNHYTPFKAISSGYIVNANGKYFSPQQNFEPNTVFSYKTDFKFHKYQLNSNSFFISVEIIFKENMIKSYITQNKKYQDAEIFNIFLKSGEKATKKIGKIAKEILNCKMEMPIIEIFFEAKSKEWLSIILDEYDKEKIIKKVSQDDINSLDRIIKYIENNISTNITQKTLEKIAFMSGTNLKTKFKKKFEMSITEYIQRKRVDVAEKILLSSDKEIKEIAKMVGYNSASRFSTIFKRYKGVYPKDVKKYFQNNHCEYDNKTL